MNKLAASPDRNTFQQERYLERQAKKGLTPENDEDTRAMAEYYQSWNDEKAAKEADPQWKKDNLEWDLRSTEWITDKARRSESYAQNIYAALCNTEWQRKDVWPILTGQRWSCSWRYAGGIVADMRGQGDYIDWYCSGIRDIGVYAPDNGKELTEEQKARVEIVNKFVGEGHVTDEVRQDLDRLGWHCVDEDHVETD